MIGTTNSIGARLAILGFGLLFAYFAVHSISTGRVKPSIHDRVYLRSEDPGTFWFHVVVYFVVGLAFVASAALWR
jgi:hypothetical protein